MEYEKSDQPGPAEGEGTFERVHFRDGDNYKDFTQVNGVAEEYTSSILMNRNVGGIEHLYDHQPEIYRAGATHISRKDSNQNAVSAQFSEFRGIQQIGEPSSELPSDDKSSGNDRTQQAINDCNMINPAFINWKRVGILDRGMSMLNLHIMQFTTQTFSTLASDVSSCVAVAV